MEFETVSSFYAGRSVLLTGGTGFMGKVILEKMLRSCPDIKNVYLLVRPRHNTQPHERVAQLVNGEIFDTLRKEQPAFADKIVPVNGELTEENLGLSAEDARHLAEVIDIVIHSAATIKFTERIKLAVDLNVVSVRKVIAFCKTVKHLKIMLHISTAYAHTNRDYIEERVYEPSFDPQKLVDVTSTLDEDMAEALTPHLLGQRPNSYTFTKSVAEYVVATEGKGLPVAIVRPSIVGSTWQSPLPGWNENFNGPVGIAMAIGTGLSRIMPGHNDAIADVIPVDIAANYIVAAAWYAATRLYPTALETPVFNCTVSAQNPCNWGTWGTSISNAFLKCPLESRVFRPIRFEFIPPTNRIEYATRSFLKHNVPGYLADFLLRVVGQKPRMARTFDRVEKANKELGFFTSRTWKWEDRRGHEMRAAMTEADRTEFRTDIIGLDWDKYIESMCLGVKQFLVKEDVNKLHKARRTAKRVWFVSYLLRLVLWYIVVRVIVPFLRARGVGKAVWLALVPVYYASKKL